MADDTLTFSDLTAEDQLNELKRLENEAIVAAGLREPVPEFDPTYAAPEGITPQAAPPIPSPVGIQPPAAPLNLPVSAGRMYMGPMLSAAEEAAFRASKAPTSVNLMPPPVVQSELERLRASDLPGSRTISIRRDIPMPVPERASELPSFALSEYQRMRNAGASEPEARSRSGIDLAAQFGRSRQRGQIVRNVNGRLVSVDEFGNATDITPPTVAPKTPIDRATLASFNSINSEITANEKKMQTLADKDELDSEEAKATADRQMQLLDERTKIQKKILESQGTTTTGVSAPSVPTQPTSASVIKIKVKSPDDRIGYIPSNQLAAALRKGYTQVR